MVGSPVYAPIALPFLQGNPANFVIGQQSFKKGKGATFAGGKTLVSTNANTSRRALQQELGPRARAGKRYLKGQSSASVPFPWAAFADAEVAPGQASILMSQTRSFDRVDPADPAQRAALAAWVPPGMLKAAEAIEALRTDLQAALGDQPPASPSSGPDGSSRRGTRRRSRHRRRQQEQEVVTATNRRDTLYVGENVAYCGACDVDSLSGPRAGACETDCAAVEARMPIPSFDFGQVQFDPVHIVMAAIEAPLPAAAVADAGGAAAVAMDVRDALRLWLRSPVVDLPDAQVAVYAADGQEDGDELVRRWLGEEEEAAAAAGDAAHREATGSSSCSQGRLRLTAAFVVHDAEAAALLRSVAQGGEEQQQMEEQEQQGDSTAAAGAAAAREALVGAVQGALPAANGEQEGDCADMDGTPAVSFQRSLFVPAYDSPEFLQEQQQQQQPGAASNAQPPINSLRLVDPLRPGVPLGAAGMGAQQNVVLGRSYRVELADFPPQASVLVALVPVPSSDPGEAEAGAKADAGATPQPVATLRTDDRGAARALWPVPRRLPPGDYYLQATAVEGRGEEGDSIWGLSQLYKVAARPARRRKLGPVLEV